MSPELFLITQIPPLLYAATNLIDKNLLSKYFTEGGVMILLMFSALLSGIVAPIAFFMHPEILNMSAESMVILAIVAVIDLLLLWSYLKALEQDDPTVVIICYQMVPIMTLATGFFFLGETISQNQAIAMVIILGGTLIAAIEFGTNKFLSFKWRTLFYMLIACACWATEIVIFKYVALEESVWPSLFWTNLIHFALGVALFAFSPISRRLFLNKFKLHGKGVLALNVTNEVLYLTGNTISYLAAMQTAVVLVLLAQTYQAIYVFVFGLLIALFTKTLYKEKLGAWAVGAKIAAIVITGIGSYLLLTQ